MSADDDDLLAERQQVTSQIDQLRRQRTPETNQTQDAVNTQSNMLHELLARIREIDNALSR